MTDTETGDPLPQALIEIIGGGQTGGILSDNQGQFRAELPAGTYALRGDPR